MEVVPPRPDKDREMALAINQKIVEGLLLHPHPARAIAELIIQTGEDATLRTIDATIQQFSALVRRAMVARVTEIGDKLAKREMT